MIFNFRKGGNSTKELYEALQYSGLVTEDMTYNEMVEVLAEAFGEKFSLIREGWTFSTNATEYDCTIIADDEQVSVTVNSFSPVNTNITMYLRSPEFYIEHFKYLDLMGSTFRTTGNTQAYYDPKISLVSAETGAKVTLHQHSISSYSTNTLRPIDKTVSVESLTGRYYVEYYLGLYTGERNTRITLTKAELRV